MVTLPVAVPDTTTVTVRVVPLLSVSDTAAAMPDTREAVHAAPAGVTVNVSRSVAEVRVSPLRPVTVTGGRQSTVNAAVWAALPPTLVTALALPSEVQATVAVLLR